MRSLIVWFILFCYLTPVLALAVPTVSSGTVQRLKDFPSDYVPQRTVDVWLPEGYSADKKHAVIYMQDGQMLFDASTTWNQQEWQVDEVGSQLIKKGLVQPFIVVAIHNAVEKRHSEYFPQRPFTTLTTAQQQQLYQLESAPGQKLFAEPVYSDLYLKFLVTELKLYIEQNFSVFQSKEHNFVMGSSMGGLISLYALLEYPEQFGGAACLSTHWPGVFAMEDNPVPEQFLAYLQQKLTTEKGSRIYFDYGDQTLDAWYPPLQARVDQLMRDKGFTAKMWQTEFFPGENHSEQAWAKRLDRPFLFLLQGVR